MGVTFGRDFIILEDILGTGTQKQVLKVTWQNGRKSRPNFCLQLLSGLTDLQDHTEDESLYPWIDQDGLNVSRIL